MHGGCFDWPLLQCTSDEAKQSQDVMTREFRDFVEALARVQAYLLAVDELVAGHDISLAKKAAVDSTRHRHTRSLNEEEVFHGEAVGVRTPRSRLDLGTLERSACWRGRVGGPDGGAKPSAGPAQDPSGQHPSP